MMNDFKFMGFTPNEVLSKQTQLVIDRLMDTAPYGSMSVALLERCDDIYQCAIEIYSKQGPFIARASGESPEVALKRVARALSKKLEKWSEAKLIWNARDPASPVFFATHPRRA